MSQPKLDQILDDFYDGVFLTEQPKAKQAIKTLMLEIASESIDEAVNLEDIFELFEKKVSEL